MATPTHINDLLQKRMDRKDFLKHVAIGMAVLTGTAGIVKLFKPERTAQSNFSYGASTYGGARPQAGR